MRCAVSVRLLRGAPCASAADARFALITDEGDRTMKKLLALTLALCLLCGTALAEISNGSRLRMDDFFLNLSKGMEYVQSSKKKADSVILTVYPYAGVEDKATSFNFYWKGKPYQISVKMLNDMLDKIKKQLVASYEDKGFRVSQVWMGEPYDAYAGGVKCCVLETQFRLQSGRETTDVLQRQFFVGSTGYVITLSATDMIRFLGADDVIDRCLRWY